MSLVAYDSSSESEDETTVQQPKRSLPTKTKKTVYVDLPKLDNDDEEEEERQSKRPKFSAGLGLADLLPAPKHTRAAAPVTKTTTDKIFIPHALSKKSKGKQKETASVKPPEEPKEEKEETVEEEEVEEEESTPTEHVGSFFHIGKDLRKEIAPKPSPKPATSLRTEYTVEREPPQEEQEPQMTAVDMYAYDPNAMYSNDPSVYYQYQQEQEAYYNNQQNAQQFEDITGLRGDTNMQIKSVNQSDMLLSDQDRAIRDLTQAPKFNTGAPLQASKLQMRTNNIMALAAHAVNNQEKLDEMFAANKRTRRDAAKKYGF